MQDSTVGTYSQCLQHHLTGIDTQAGGVPLSVIAEMIVDILTIRLPWGRAGAANTNTVRLMVLMCGRKITTDMGTRETPRTAHAPAVLTHMLVLEGLPARARGMTRPIQVSMSGFALPVEMRISTPTTPGLQTTVEGKPTAAAPQGRSHSTWM